MKIAINGFGRIGRLVFKHLYNRTGVEIVAVNDLSDVSTLAHLLKYDSTQGSFKHGVETSENNLVIDGSKIPTYSESKPENLPWDKLAVDVVIESTGVFRTKDKASLHLKAGAKKVVLSAPAKSEGIQTIVLGVNDEILSMENDVFSNASCTTNCLAPQVKVLNEKWGIGSGFMTTTHAYTSSQNIQDGTHKDLRRARAAAENIIPTTTGAAKATEIVYPKIKDKLVAMAFRVPVPVGSLTEMTFTLEDSSVTVADINSLFLNESENNYKGIIEYCEDPIVSSDIIGNKHSAIFDSLLTSQSGNMYKIVAWYDNEAGYSSRLADLCEKIGSLI